MLRVTAPMTTESKWQKVVGDVLLGCVLLSAGCTHMSMRGERRPVWPPRGRSAEDLGLGPLTDEENIPLAESAEPDGPVEPAELALSDIPADTNAPAGTADPQAPRLSPGVRVKVEVTVGGSQEIEETCSVSTQGELHLPLIKSVPVGGMTREEAVAYLTERYRKFLRDPEVSIVFSAAGEGEGISPWGYVTVMGRVKSPKRIALPGLRGLTLSQAIALAGGLDTSAKDRSVRLTRRKPDGTFDKQTVNLREIVASGRVEEDILLRDGDIIFVPETWL